MKSFDLAHGEEKRIEDALEALAKDPHAPRQISVNVNLHVHNEYPKVLYKGKQAASVAHAEAEQAARDNGYGDYQPEPAEE